MSTANTPSNEMIKTSPILNSKLKEAERMGITSKDIIDGIKNKVIREKIKEVGRQGDVERMLLEKESVFLRFEKTGVEFDLAYFEAFSSMIGPVIDEDPKLYTDIVDLLNKMILEKKLEKLKVSVSPELTTLATERKSPDINEFKIDKTDDLENLSKRQEIDVKTLKIGELKGLKELSEIEDYNLHNLKIPKEDIIEKFNGNAFLKNEINSSLNAIDLNLNKLPVTIDIYSSNLDLISSFIKKISAYIDKREYADNKADLENLIVILQGKLHESCKAINIAILKKVKINSDSISLYWVTSDNKGSSKIYYNSDAKKSALAKINEECNSDKTKNLKSAAKEMSNLVAKKQIEEVLKITQEIDREIDSKENLTILAIDNIAKKADKAIKYLQEVLKSTGFDNPGEGAKPETKNEKNYCNVLFDGLYPIFNKLNKILEVYNFRRVDVNIGGIQYPICENFNDLIGYKGINESTLFTVIGVEKCIDEMIKLGEKNVVGKSPYLKKAKDIAFNQLGKKFLENVVEEIKGIDELINKARVESIYVYKIDKIIEKVDKNIKNLQKLLQVKGFENNPAVLEFISSLEEKLETVIQLYNYTAITEGSVDSIKYIVREKNGGGEEDVDKKGAYKEIGVLNGYCGKFKNTKEIINEMIENGVKNTYKKIFENNPSADKNTKEVLYWAGQKFLENIFKQIEDINSVIEENKDDMSILILNKSILEGLVNAINDIQISLNIPEFKENSLFSDILTELETKVIEILKLFNIEKFISSNKDQPISVKYLVKHKTGNVQLLEFNGDRDTTERTKQEYLIRMVTKYWDHVKVTENEQLKEQVCSQIAGLREKLLQDVFYEIYGTNARLEKAQESNKNDYDKYSYVIKEYIDERNTLKNIQLSLEKEGLKDELVAKLITDLDNKINELCDKQNEENIKNISGKEKLHIYFVGDDGTLQNVEIEINANNTSDRILMGFIKNEGWDSHAVRHASKKNLDLGERIKTMSVKFLTESMPKLNGKSKEYSDRFVSEKQGFSQEKAEKLKKDIKRDSEKIVNFKEFLNKNNNIENAYEHIKTFEAQEEALGNLEKEILDFEITTCKEQAEAIKNKMEGVVIGFYKIDIKNVNSSNKTIDGAIKENEIVESWIKSLGGNEEIKNVLNLNKNIKDLFYKELKIHDFLIKDYKIDKNSWGDDENDIDKASKVCVVSIDLLEGIKELKKLFEGENEIQAEIDEVIAFLESKRDEGKVYIKERFDFIDEGKEVLADDILGVVQETHGGIAEVLDIFDILNVPEKVDDDSKYIETLYGIFMKGKEEYRGKYEEELKNEAKKKIELNINELKNDEYKNNLAHIKNLYDTVKNPEKIELSAIGDWTDQGAKEMTEQLINEYKDKLRSLTKKAYTPDLQSKLESPIALFIETQKQINSLNQSLENVTIDEIKEDMLIEYCFDNIQELRDNLEQKGGDNTLEEFKKESITKVKLLIEQKVAEAKLEKIRRSAPLNLIKLKTDLYFNRSEVLNKMKTDKIRMLEDQMNKEKDELEAAYKEFTDLYKRVFLNLSKEESNSYFVKAQYDNSFPTIRFEGLGSKIKNSGKFLMEPEKSTEKIKFLNSKLDNLGNIYSSKLEIFNELERERKEIRGKDFYDSQKEVQYDWARDILKYSYPEEFGHLEETNQEDPRNFKHPLIEALTSENEIYKNREFKKMLDFSNHFNSSNNMIVEVANLHTLFEIRGRNDDEIYEKNSLKEKFVSKLTETFLEDKNDKDPELILAFYKKLYEKIERIENLRNFLNRNGSTVEDTKQIVNKFNSFLEKYGYSIFQKNLTDFIKSKDKTFFEGLFAELKNKKDELERVKSEKDALEKEKEAVKKEYEELSFVLSGGGDKNERKTKFPEVTKAFNARFKGSAEFKGFADLEGELGVIKKSFKEELGVDKIAGTDGEKLFTLFKSNVISKLQEIKIRLDNNTEANKFQEAKKICEEIPNLTLQNVWNEVETDYNEKKSAE